MFSIEETGILHAASNGVLHEIHDYRRRLPVDSDRNRDAVQDVGLEVRDRHGDLVGRELRAANGRGARVQLEHDPRTAASWSGAGATCRGMIRPSSRRDAVIAETVVGLRSVWAEISTREIGPEPTNGVHDMEAIDRPHQLRIGGLHRGTVERPAGSQAFIAGHGFYLRAGAVDCQCRELSSGATSLDKGERRAPRDLIA